MNNEEIMRVALEQSALDCLCKIEDFSSGRPVLNRARKNPLARIYIKQPQYCDIVSYGTNAVAVATEEAFSAAEKYLSRVPAAHAFETPSLYLLNESLAPLGLRVCFMAEYFLPDVERLRPLPCAYRLKTFEPNEGLYGKEWGNALCAERKYADRLCVGAYDGEILVGLAGCSADCESMWQIGVDVLPAYRGKGIASAMTSALAIEVFKRGKVPFYCAAWCNLPSVRNAIKSGFKPAWVQASAMPVDYIKSLTKEFNAEKE